MCYFPSHPRGYHKTPCILEADCISMYYPFKVTCLVYHGSKKEEHKQEMSTELGRGTNQAQQGHLLHPNLKVALGNQGKLSSAAEAEPLGGVEALMPAQHHSQPAHDRELTNSGLRSANSFSPRCGSQLCCINVRKRDGKAGPFTLCNDNQMLK